MAIWIIIMGSRKSDKIPLWDNLPLIQSVVKLLKRKKTFYHCLIISIRICWLMTGWNNEECDGCWVCRSLTMQQKCQTVLDILISRQTSCMLVRNSLLVMKSTDLHCKFFTINGYMRHLSSTRVMHNIFFYLNFIGIFRVDTSESLIINYL